MCGETMVEINGNKLRALIKDEKMASEEYKKLAYEVGVNTEMGQRLIGMSFDERRHHNILVNYRNKIKK